MVGKRGSILAGLVLVAVAAPLTAYAVSVADDTDHPGPASHGPKAHGSSHGARQKHGTGAGHDDASAVGRAHADAMKAWARCVAEAASGPKTESAPTPPKSACGDKPVGPGRAKHATGGTAPGKSGDHPSHRGRGHTS